MRAADVMESFDAVAQGLDLDESFVEFVSEKPVFAPQRVNGVGQWLMGRGHYLTPRAVLIGLRPKHSWTLNNAYGPVFRRGRHWRD